MASRLVQAHTTAFGSSVSRVSRRAFPGAAQRRSDGRASRVFVAPRLREMAPGPRGRAAAAADDDIPELPDYDVVTLGPLETSALALSLRGWKGGSDDANAFAPASFLEHPRVPGVRLRARARVRRARGRPRGRPRASSHPSSQSTRDCSTSATNASPELKARRVCSS